MLSLSRNGKKKKSYLIFARKNPTSAKRIVEPKNIENGTGALQLPTPYKSSKRNPPNKNSQN
jgi:hypothetical protein